MKTFLRLVNDVERESGTVNLHARTSDVTSPESGRQEKIIEHVNLAYEQIQLARSDWPWRRAEFTHALTPGQTRYEPADLGITSLAGWVPSNDEERVFTIYDGTPADETGLIEVGYRAWRDRYDVGVHDAQRPSIYGIDHNLRLCLGPKPDKAYTVRGAYMRGVHVLVNNSDTPIIPPNHHSVIVWKALMLLHGHDEGEFALGNAGAHYRAAYRALVNSTAERIGD